MVSTPIPTLFVARSSRLAVITYFSFFIALTYFPSSDQGASVDVTVVDACEACSITSLDFSPSAFSVLANQTVGRISIDWVWS